MKLLRMSSPAEMSSIRTLTSPSVGGGESGDSDVSSGKAFPETGGVRVAALEPFLCQESRWCANCAGQMLFYFVFVCEGGRGGFCLGCDEEKFIPWTRANSEVA